MPFSGTRCGIGHHGFVRKSWMHTTSIISPMTNQWEAYQWRSWAKRAEYHACTSMLVSRMMCRQGKKTPMSRVGVIHNCMFDIFSNVP